MISGAGQYYEKNERPDKHCQSRLTTSTWSSQIASANFQTHFRKVFGSTAPLEPPTPQHAGPWFGYTLKKNRVQRKCLILPFAGSWRFSRRRFQTMHAIETLVPKNSRKILFSIPLDPTRRPIRFWISLATVLKSSGVALDGNIMTYQPSEWRNGGYF